MSHCPNSINKIFLQKKRYPQQNFDCYFVSAAEVAKILLKGAVPQLRLIDESEGAVVAVLPAVEKNPLQSEPDYAIPEFYVEALRKNGVNPVFVAFDKVKEQLECLQPKAIMLPGGDFAFPAEMLEGEQPESGNLRREKAYETMVEYARENKLPLFGICAGEQVLAGMFGAKLKKVEGHRQAPDKYAHKIRIKPHSLLAKISGFAEADVNTNHNMAVLQTNDSGIVASAEAEDGTVEAVELKAPWHSFVLGVQWHPERFVFGNDDLTNRLFAAFAKAARGGIPLTRERIAFTEANMVEIDDEHFIVDMVYAGNKNISGHAVYQEIGFGNRAYVRVELWERLQNLVPWLEEHKLKLKICDAYRPLAAHSGLKKAIHEQGAGLFASSGELSKHCHGTAVDVVLCHKDGTELKYPTRVDCYTPEFSTKVQNGDTSEFYEYAKQGRQDYQNPSMETEIANREQLRRLMESIGLEAISSEWWHYEMPDEYNLVYPVIEW